MKLASRCTKFWLLALLMVILSSNAISEEKGGIKFSFAPGDRISFMQRLTTTKDKDMADKGRQLDESISTTTIFMDRHRFTILSDWLHSLSIE